MKPTRSLASGRSSFFSPPPPLAHRRVPDVHAFVEGAAGQVLAVGAESHAVDGFLMLGQRVDADAALDVPQSHGGVEGGAEGTTRVIKQLYFIYVFRVFFFFNVNSIISLGFKDTLLLYV